MYLKQNLLVALLAFLCISRSVAGANEAWAYEQSNMKLVYFLSNYSEILQNDSSNSLKCLSYYMPLIFSLGQIFEMSYTQCEEVFEETKEKVEAALFDKRIDLSSKASKACEMLNKCIFMEEVEKEFECYINGSSENENIMQEVNANAQAYLTEFQDSLQIIESINLECINESKLVYEKDVEKANEDLNNCIMGVTEVPEPTELPALGLRLKMSNNN